MAKMLDISTELAPDRWLNLDNVLLVEVVRDVEYKESPYKAEKQTVDLVKISLVPGGAGWLLPPHITLEQVLEAMK